MKLKHYMHIGLSIYQNKYFKTTFLSPTSPVLDHIQSSSSGQNNIITLEIATNRLFITKELQLHLKKQINMCCSFNKISIKKKNWSARKVDPTINFDLIINFDFFGTNNLGLPYGMSVTFGLWTFHKLLKRQKNFDVIDFWLPC